MALAGVVSGRDLGAPIGCRVSGGVVMGLIPLGLGVGVVIAGGEVADACSSSSAALAALASCSSVNCWSTKSLSCAGAERAGTTN
eukprot:5110774-Amphidinium_carterae.1